MTTKPRVPKTCECGNEKAHRRAIGCPSCLEIERQRKAAESVSGRIVTALHRMDDWASAADIMDATGVDRVCLSSRLCYLVKCGQVEQTWSKGMGMMYRPARRAA
jgi:hypothetical protein